MLMLNNYIMDNYSHEEENDNDSIQEDATESKEDRVVAADSSQKDTVETKEDKIATDDSSQEDSVELKEDKVATDNSSQENDIDSKEDEKTSNENQSNDLDDFVLPFLIGKKIGMTQLFSEGGTSFPVTVIEAGPCTVLQIKNIKNEGYSSVQLGFLDKKESKTNKPLMGHFNKSKSSPKSHLKEFRLVENIENLSLGNSVTVNQFNEGDFVTITGVSKGKGFAGHMKRHGFSGGRASHGKNSVMRKAGSVGAGTSPGRIFPGMKMAGRMGNQKVSIKNLSILNIDRNKNLIFVSGSVPGPNNNIIYLSKS